jgi:hypothetical protein
MQHPADDLHADIVGPRLAHLQQLPRAGRAGWYATYDPL